MFFYELFTRWICRSVEETFHLVWQTSLTQLKRNQQSQEWSKVFRILCSMFQHLRRHLHTTPIPGKPWFLFNGNKENWLTWCHNKWTLVSHIVHWIYFQGLAVSAADSLPGCRIYLTLKKKKCLMYRKLKVADEAKNMCLLWQICTDVMVKVLGSICKSKMLKKKMSGM